MGTGGPEHDRQAIERARERGWIALEEILGLAADSPVDVDEAKALTRDAGIRLIDGGEQDPWEDLVRLADDGPGAFSESEGPARTQDFQADEPAALYLREISQTPLLNAQQEVALAKRIEQGRDARGRLDAGIVDPEEQARLDALVREGEAARRHMIEANLRLVVSVARKFLGRGLSFLDLVQEGNIGLQKGVDRFDWRKGFRFSTYAYWWIRQAIGRAVAEKGREIRLPSHVIEQLTKIYNTARELQAEFGRSPTPEEIGSRLEVPADRIRDAFRAARLPLSLEMPVGDEQASTLADLIADTDGPGTEDQAVDEVLASALDRALFTYLTPLEAHVVRMRFGLDRGGQERTLSEVGQEIGMSRERARQLEGQAMAKLRQATGFRRRFGEFVA
jgi:RNA polymerase primary sigma factor